MPFSNVYDDAERARAYAALEFPGTYYLAYRDLPAIIAQHVIGREALDFGCGAGRSTRFLKKLGFTAVGIDISKSMIELAAKADPDGDYRLVEDGDFDGFVPVSFDLIFSAFAFDNIPDVTKRSELLRSLRGLLRNHGRIILLGSTPDIYLHEWASFTGKPQCDERPAGPDRDEGCHGLASRRRYCLVAPRLPEAFCRVGPRPCCLLCAAGARRRSLQLDI